MENTCSMETRGFHSNMKQSKVGVIWTLTLASILATIGGHDMVHFAEAFSPAAPLSVSSKLGSTSSRTDSIPGGSSVSSTAGISTRQKLHVPKSNKYNNNVDDNEERIQGTINRQHGDFQRFIKRQQQQQQHHKLVPLRAPSIVSVDVSGSVTAGATSTKDVTSTSDMTTTTSSTRSFEPSSRDINIARLLLLVAAALYGTNFSLVKMLGETDIPVGMSSALRFGMAALATSPWLLSSSSQADDGVKRQGGFMLSAEEWDATKLGFEVGVWNSIGYVAQAVGLETTAASKSAFICSLAVVTVPLLDFLVGKKLLPRQSMGALLALSGVGILELGGMDAADFALTNGDIASLIQPICFGIGFWRMEAAMQKYPDEANRSTASQLMAVFMASFAYALFSDSSYFNFDTIMGWLSQPSILFSLFWTGCISTALTVYMETLALKSLSAAETTLIFSTEPLWGTAFASVVMGETLGWESGVGALLILGGCLFSNLGVDGVKEMVFKSKEAVPTTAGDATGESTGKPVLGSLLQAGAASAVGIAVLSVWDDLSTGTKYAAMQVEDIVENLF